MLLCAKYFFYHIYPESIWNAIIESQIATCLESMSRNLAHVGHLPSSQIFSTMREDLAFKEGEVEKSKNTLEGLSREHQQLALNLGSFSGGSHRYHTE
jgi:hypothetical protein